ncbi:hypothetical protein MIMGU_mgv1a016297mg [Erythranthe guttata]|uniref:C2H2-type domain-containing protein n=1 Tax=Erythranthe guttata TaxID=4155 RepID=A0A022RXN4_ERYGU|nr:hypothetical protein MIMGU_mgv1a016297mg [Erythranthe guttata]
MERLITDPAVIMKDKKVSRFWVCDLRRSPDESESVEAREEFEACQVVDDVPPDHICPACLRDHESPRCPVCNIPFLSNKDMRQHFQEKHNKAEWIADLVSKAGELLSQQPPEVLASLSEWMSKNFGN